MTDRDELAQFLYGIRAELRSAGDSNHWLDLADRLISAGVVAQPSTESATADLDGIPGAYRPVLDVFVPGRPAPQGSKRLLAHGALVESSKHVKPWRTDIRAAAIDDRGGFPPETAAMHVVLAFVMPRPTSTPRRRTPAAVKRPDLDKLIRAVLDAVGSAGVWVDDSQVVGLHATKRIAEIGEAPGCRITVHTPAGEP